MPCIKVKTSQNLKSELKQQLILALSGKTAELLAKPEKYVMVIVEDNITMSMSATADPAAYVEFKSINLPEDNTRQLSAAICKQLHEQLNIENERIYIEFSNAQRHLWGWNESTF